jgi:hypothetical protein
MPETPPLSPRSKSALYDCWLAEIVRLRETRHGPLDDAAAVRQARHAGGSFSQRLIYRAGYLAQKEKLNQVLNRWLLLARAALLLLGATALLAGAGTAAGALGDGSRTVNVVMALAALLGVPTLTLIVWWLSGFVQAGQTSALGDAGLWISGKLARGPNAALAPAALLELTQQRRSTRALSGMVSHAFWLLALSAAIITLLVLLSARRYNFSWETTLLSADTFVALTQNLGLLPALLGFPIPPEAIVRASDGLQSLPGQANTLWSGWLVGCVFVYGLLPRLVLLVLNAATVGRRLGNCEPDPALPGFAELHDRLMPASTRTGIDAPAPAPHALQTAGTHSTIASGSAAIVGLELPADQNWPIFTLPASIANLGNIDGRSERNAVLDRVHAHAPARLLIVCDATQTPDRGSLAFLAELAAPTGANTGFLLHESATAPTRLATWREKLKQAGFAAASIHTQADDALAWLAQTSKPAPAGATPTDA